ncbi:hypothetical protein TUM4630_12240 [Shewanella algidipiscicola]|uniref:Uncharacterized protein n=2 Tax=Shewanella algidipiscicola TaxID=614070 RepID=A0ABQ4PCC9_9GAMM|nr:hypothetical protein TUM4630_12240 [Shewanella algidipiscicola]
MKTKAQLRLCFFVGDFQDSFFRYCLILNYLTLKVTCDFELDHIILWGKIWRKNVLTQRCELTNELFWGILAVMNRKKKINQTLKAKAKKANAKLHHTGKPKYISKAERERLAVEIEHSSENAS